MISPSLTLTCCLRSVVMPMPLLECLRRTGALVAEGEDALFWRAPPPPPSPPCRDDGVAAFCSCARVGDDDVERARAAGGAEGLGLVGVSPLPSSPSPNQATCATSESQSLPSGEEGEDMWARTERVVSST